MTALSSSRRLTLIAAAQTLADENKGAPTTLRTRAVAIRSWLRFAGKCVPKEELVWLYVVDELRKNRKPRGIKTYLAAIKKYYRLKDPDFNVNVFESGRIKDALWQGAARMRKAGVFTKRAVVVKESQIRNLCSKADTFDKKLIAALAVALFFNLNRGAELVLPGHVRAQVYNKIPLFGNAISDYSRTTIRILSQKNDQCRPVDLHFTKDNTPHWARRMLCAYIDARSAESNGLRSLPELFLRKDGVAPTTSWLMRQLKAAWGPDHTIHGLRAGGATRMALLGFSAFFIQLAGRWSSDAFLAYIGENEELAAALAHNDNLPVSQVRRRRH